MDKSYHWINDSVKIDFALPSMIQELVDELEKWIFQEGRLVMLTDVDSLRILQKEFVINKEMTSKQRISYVKDIVEDKHMYLIDFNI